LDGVCQAPSLDTPQGISHLPRYDLHARLPHP